MSRESLTGPEIRQLTEALVAAFDSDGLERLVSFYLEQDLAIIVDAGTHQDTAFELIRWAIRHGELPTLVEAAFAVNPKNPALARFRTDVWEAGLIVAAGSAPEPPRSVSKPSSGTLPVTVESPGDTASAKPSSTTAVDRWTMNRRVVIPAAAGLAGLGIAYLLFGRQRASVSFGRVPLPPFTDRLIPDVESASWDELGQRTVRGVVYHRAFQSIQGLDDLFREVPPGGADDCDDVSDPSTFGGCNALSDFGIDNTTGEILRWNDPFGLAHTDLGVSPNRSGWANGPVSEPSDAVEAFVARNSIGAINRDLASIEIGGNLEDPISEACKLAIAALSAYFADQYKIRWDEYPAIPDLAYGFVHWHNQIARNRDCPGTVVRDATDEITNRTREILRRYQVV